MDKFPAIDTEPMEARSVDALPTGDMWQFEPKWDGFRCLAFKSSGLVDLRAKSGKSLSRYFPEMVAALAGGAADNFVLDGELAIRPAKRSRLRRCRTVSTRPKAASASSRPKHRRC